MALTELTKVQKIGINSTTIPTFGGSRNTGVVTATTFVGDGSGLSGVTGSGAGVIVRDGGSLVGTAGTINFGTNLNVSAISAGIVTVTNAASATALTNLSDVTVSSASNGQILKHNGSAFVNVADTTYSQSSVASGSNVNLRLSDGSTDDDILITAGSNITFSSVSAGGFTIAASGGGGGGGLSNVVEDTTPQLGGSLDLNNKFITGSGGINVSGATTSTSFVGALTGNVTGNADTATTATNVTVSANNSTDETVYPIFVDGATGGQGAESDTGFTYNPSSGNLTATKFTGSGVALTGVVTSIVAGSNITLTGGPTGIVTIASSGGSSGVTVQDEGSALSTSGTTLNFVGSGVVASGTGATKTITIAGGVTFPGGTANTVAGTNAGDAIVSGASHNTLFGHNAGQDINTGDYNTFVGSRSGFNASTGLHNTGVGYNVMGNHGGWGGAALGRDAGNGMGGSNYSIAIGFGAYSNITANGNNNIVIGYQANVSSSSASNEITFGNDDITHFRIPGIGVSFSEGGAVVSGVVTASNVSVGSSISVGTGAVSYTHLTLPTNREV